MLDIRDVVRDPQWQRLRQGLVGTWKRQPAENVRLLRDYAGDFTDPLRLRRLHNYLTGTAFRIGAIQHPDITALLQEVRAARSCAKTGSSAPDLANAALRI